MASISKSKNGHRTIQFVAGDGRRRSIRLGKVSQRIAENVKVRIEALNSAVVSGQPIDGETARWLGNIDGPLKEKLARAGLCDTPQSREPATLAAFIDSYIAGRTDAKPNTLKVWGHTRRCLVEFYGAERALSCTTPGDTDEVRLWMLSQGLGENTVRRRCGFAKQFLRAAVRKKLISENPFSDMQGTTVRGNRERDYFITRDEAAAVLDACPDAQGRLLFALSRFGGLSVRPNT